MFVRSLSDNAYQESFNILCHSHRLSDNGHEHPFHLTSCRVPPHGSTLPHLHSEAEKFFIISGQGTMQIEDDFLPVGAGDIVHIPPFSNHQIRNDDERSELIFHSIYYVPETKNPPQIAIAAPPTPNGPLHLGHLSGPYLAADLFKRANPGTILISGTDDDQSYVQFLSERDKNTHASQHFIEQIPSTLKKANISVDIFQQPSKQSDYKNNVLRFWEQLKNSRYVSLKDVDLPFCVDCDRHRAGAFISGKCPHCDADTSGGGCEVCHLPNQHIDLKSAQCSICRSDLHPQRVSVYVLDLEKLRDKVKGSVAQIEMPGYLRKVLEQSQGTYPYIILSYPMESGISVKERPGQVLFEWVEMFLGYLSILLERRFARPDVHLFFGIDNSYFYGVFHVALFHAMGIDDLIPKSFQTNTFLNLDQKKFSTSRRHAIWVEEITGVMPADSLRLYLSYIRSGEQQSNFTVEGYARFIQEVLVEGLEPLFTSSLQSGRSTFTALELSILNSIRDSAKWLNKNHFDSKKSAESLVLAIELSKYLQTSSEGSAETWGQIRAELRSVLKVFMPHRFTDTSEDVTLNFRSDLLSITEFRKSKGESI